MAEELIPGIEPDDRPADLFVFNGINGATGSYGVEPKSQQELVKLIRGEEDEAFRQDLAEKAETIDFPSTAEDSTVAQNGWGIIFPVEPQSHSTEAVLEAMSELIALRRWQAGGPYTGPVDDEGNYTGGGLFRIFAGADGYRPGESSREFIRRFGAGTGIVNPRKGVPYYLLLVGTPEEIPYYFQFQLDVQFGVGRICFETLEEYANYARNVVEVERGEVTVDRRAAFFGVTNDHDRATQLSTQHQVLPLYNTLKTDFSDWDMSTFIGKEANQPATKAQLSHLLTGQKPALLFTASHGMEFPQDDPRQLPHQGAILCQDWRGPRRHRGPISEELYFSKDDIDSQTDLRGLITFCFACFGGGCPHRDEFAYGKKRPVIAPKPFLAGLPTKMLGKPKGALAFIGHVERAWGYSIVESGLQGAAGGRNITPMRETLEYLLWGDAAGWSTDLTLNFRFAQLATDLTFKMEQIDRNKFEFPDRYEADLAREGPELVKMWTEHNDARGYIIIGDPAARLPVAEDFTPAPAAGDAAYELTGSAASQPATATATAPATELGETGEAESFGWFGGGDDKKEAAAEEATGEPTAAEPGLAQSLQTVAKELAAKLSQAVDDLTSLEVLTYTSDDINQAKADYDSKRDINSAQTQLRAMTRIFLDGDIVNLVPKTGESDFGTQIDRELWETHLQMVQLAQTNRVEFLKALGEITGTVVRAIR